jgi:hypothetical protein
VLYIGILVAAVLAFLAALAAGAPLPGLAAALVVALASGYIAWRYRQFRKTFSKPPVRWVTSHGVKIMPGKAEAWLVSRKDELEHAITQAMSWYCSKHSAEAVRRGVARATLQVVAQDGPLEVPRWNIKARRLTDGLEMTVLWELKTGGADFFDVLRHEIGHVCLNAIGMASELHHEDMYRTGYPYA